jgi:polyisoprenoid-binding protein YceI
MKKYSAALIILAMSSMAFADHYEIDPDHSQVNFKIRHLVTKVQGKFQKFQGNFDYNPKDSKANKAVVAIQTASINTGVTKRDEHLRSPDFFDAKKFPEIKFESTSADLSSSTGKISGNLTMHGVTKPVTFDVEVGGQAKDPWGNQRAGFTATTKVNRKDFGLNWNKTLESGGLLVGDDVEIEMNVEGIAKQASVTKQ